MGDLKNYFNRNDTILTVFSLVCALYYGVTAIKRLFSFVRALFLGYLFGFRIIVTAVFAMLDVALGREPRRIAMDCCFVLLVEEWPLRWSGYSRDLFISYFIMGDSLYISGDFPQLLWALYW